VVAGGTTVFAEPGVGPWAKIEKDVAFHVHYDGVETWAWIDIPGLSGPELSAYVPIAAIKR
jgi:hypothetical protein